MEYRCKELESCGKTFFRVLQRRNVGDAWVMVPGSLDYDLKEDARHKIKELNETEQAKSKYKVLYCGECLMAHVDCVPMNLNGTCSCCATGHKLAGAKV